MKKIATDPPIFLPPEVNLASPRMGSHAAAASNEFFAPLPRMLADSEPIFTPDKFDNHGKWMDGWETERRRHGGNDWALIALGAPGRIISIDLDTRHFTGNFPPQAKVEGCMCADTPDDSADWKELLPQTNLEGNTHNIFSAEDGGVVNWVRLSIYPDGGIARLRLFGNVCPDFSNNSGTELIELSHLCSGGRIIAYNDAHYGDVRAILSSGRGITMGDGWETRRRRTPGNDWIIIALGHAGYSQAIEIDTAHFKGNCPESCSVQGVYLPPDTTSEDIVTGADDWPDILPRSELHIDSVHRFDKDGLHNSDSPITHVRLNIYPDGGVSRFRVFGILAKQ